MNTKAYLKKFGFLGKAGGDRVKKFESVCNLLSLVRPPKVYIPWFIAGVLLIPGSEDFHGPIKSLICGFV